MKMEDGHCNKRSPRCCPVTGTDRISAPIRALFCSQVCQTPDLILRSINRSIDPSIDRCSIRRSLACLWLFNKISLPNPTQLPENVMEGGGGGHGNCQQEKGGVSGPQIRRSKPLFEPLVSQPAAALVLLRGEAGQPTPKINDRAAAASCDPS